MRSEAPSRLQSAFFHAAVFFALSAGLVLLAGLLNDPESDSNIFSPLVYAGLTFSSPFSWMVAFFVRDGISEFIVAAAMIAHYPFVGFAWGWKRPLDEFRVGTAIKRFFITIGLFALFGIVLGIAGMMLLEGA